MEVEHVDPQAPVRVTDAAVRHFRQQIGAARAAGLRLSVKESGCTGYMYVIDLVDAPPADDLLLELASDVRLWVDRASVPVLRFAERIFEIVVDGIDVAHAAAHHGHARGVVAAILQAAQSFHDHAQRVARADVAYDAAHLSPDYS